MLDEIYRLFGTRDIFAIIGLDKEKSATIEPKSIRDAYLKAAKRYHPDKFPDEEKELATKKFQYLGVIRKIMEDEDIRICVAATGGWPEGDQYDSGLFAATVNSADLEAFKREYQGSEEEREEIKKLYTEGEGKLTHIYENLFFANILDDEERISGIIDELVKSGDVIPPTSEDAVLELQEEKEQLIDQAREEAAEAEEAKKEMGIKMDGEEDLKSIILARNKDRSDAFLSSLEEKYGNAKEPKKRGRKPKSGDSPDGKRAKNGNGEHPVDDSNRRVTRRMARSSTNSSE